MKKLILLGVISLVCSYCFSQVHFEKGYFIDNEGKKTECLIKNMDWGYNPTEFKYKDNENSSIKIKTAKDIKEFYVEEQKYISKIVKIDISSDNYQTLTNYREPTFQTKRILLKVLLEGKVDLYEYNTLRYTRYFIKDKEDGIKPLIYKEYFKTPHIIAKNNQFQQDLWMKYRIKGIAFKDMKDVEYNSKNLIKYFSKYNESDLPKRTNIAIRERGVEKKNKLFNKKKTDKFNLHLRSGLIFSNAEVNLPILPSTGTLKNYTDYRIELEAEFMLPFNKNKWAFIISPAYKSINTEETQEGNSGTQHLSFSYNSLEFQIGGRHYMYLDDNSKLSLTAIIYTESIQKEHIGTKYTYRNEFKPRFINYKLALGYTFKNKFSFEVKYALPKNLIKYSTAGGLDYSELSMTLGYNIF